MNKYKRHRLKNMRLGICPRCTDIAAPYTYCEYHRQWYKLNRLLNRMARVGLVTKPGPGLYQYLKSDVKLVEKKSDSPTDKRHWPRLGKVPFKIEELAEQFLRHSMRPLSTKEITRLSENEMSRLKQIRLEKLYG